MRLAFELSGEHRTLPRAEVLAVLDSTGIRYRTAEVESARLLVLEFEADDIERVRPHLERTVIYKHIQLNRAGDTFVLYAKEKGNYGVITHFLIRLALTHYVTRLLLNCEPHELLDKVAALEIGLGSIRIRKKYLTIGRARVDTSPSSPINTTTAVKRAGKDAIRNDKLYSGIERRVGAILSARHPIDLTTPDIDLRLYLTDRCYLCETLIEIDRGTFEDRKVQFRPFSSPVSLHPRLARALVNLARVRPGETLYDPFCGTGGILIEAALVGARAAGSDIDERMVKGCEANLRFYGLEDFSVFQADVSDANINCDAIVTDPPYGRSATTKKEHIESLYERAFAKFDEILAPNRYLVIVLPDKKHIKIGERHFELKETFEVRVHRSLTRWVAVYRKGG